MLVGSVLGWAADEGGAEAEPLRGAQVVVVRGDHDALRRRQAELVGGSEVGLRLRLVAAGGLGAEDGVPRQAGPLGRGKVYPTL